MLKSWQSISFLASVTIETTRFGLNVLHVVLATTTQWLDLTEWINEGIAKVNWHTLLLISISLNVLNVTSNNSSILSIWKWELEWKEISPTHVFHEKLEFLCEHIQRVHDSRAIVHMTLGNAVNRLFDIFSHTNNETERKEDEQKERRGTTYVGKTKALSILSREINKIISNQ
jgi:hypothetical protein